jgi:hypothetical protein
MFNAPRLFGGHGEHRASGSATRLCNERDNPSRWCAPTPAVQADDPHNKISSKGLWITWRMSSVPSLASATFTASFNASKKILKGPPGKEFF